jgi:hypothetical protein
VSTTPEPPQHDCVDAYGAALGNALRALSTISQEMHWLSAVMGDEARLRSIEPGQLAEAISELRGLRSVLVDAEQHSRRCRTVLDPDAQVGPDLGVPTT